MSKRADALADKIVARRKDPGETYRVEGSYVLPGREPGKRREILRLFGLKGEDAGRHIWVPVAFFANPKNWFIVAGGA